VWLLILSSHGSSALAVRFLHLLVLRQFFHANSIEADSEIQRGRQERGMPPLTLNALFNFFSQQPSLCAWSPSVFPGYADWSNGPSPVPVCGYCTINRREQVERFSPSGELKAFLSATDEPPVYIGW
jgi:hypothetical protein